MQNYGSETSQKMSKKYRKDTHTNRPTQEDKLGTLAPDNFQNKRYDALGLNPMIQPVFKNGVETNTLSQETIDKFNLKNVIDKSVNS